MYTVHPVHHLSIPHVQLGTKLVTRVGSKGQLADYGTK